MQTEVVTPSAIQSELPTATTGATSSTLFSSSRITKRKLQDALDALDDATSSSGADAQRRGEGDVRPSPLKRANTSIYSSLAKYGIHVGRKPGNRQESNSSSALSRLFSTRNSSRRSPSHGPRSASDTTSNRPSISHPFALSPNMSTVERSGGAHSAFTFTTSPLASPIPVPLYRPSSAPDFIERLSTFKLSTYRDKPAAIDAVAAARCGWRNEGGKDRLACNVCGAAWIVGNTTGMTREAASALVARHVTSLVQGHKTSCPWRLRQCDPTIYRLPLKNSGALVRDIIKRATLLSRMVEHVTIKHPMTPSQLDTLSAVVAEAEQPDTAPFDSATQIPPSHNTSTDLPQTAIILALFGWEQLAPSTTRHSTSSVDLVRNRSTSRLGHGRSSSGQGSGHSTPVPQGATVERKPSGSVRSVTFVDGPSQRRLGKGREFESGVLSAIESTSGDGESVNATHESGAPPHRSRTMALRREATGHSDTFGKDDMIHCALCQRRVGLWAFTSPPLPTPPSDTSPEGSGSGEGAIPTVIKTAPVRPLDVLREHRAFCPYVIRTTPVTLPSGDESATEVEGWKAILGIISRSKRQPSISAPLSSNTFREPSPGQKGVESAVSRVKHSPSGSRDLLRYVKGLLA